MLVAAAAGVYEAHEASNARAQLRAAQQQGSAHSSQIDELTRQRDDLSRQLASINEAKTKSGGNELLRLRNEVGQLRGQLAAASRARSKESADVKNEEKGITPEEAMRQEAVAKMNYARQWLIAFMIFAEKNQGQFPTNFAQADQFLGPESKIEHSLKPDEYPPGGMKFGLVPENYEITFQGSLQSLTNPSAQIVLREKQPRQVDDGGYVRAYGFADGHTEIHRAAADHGPDEIGFETWEAQHGLVAAQPQ